MKYNHHETKHKKRCTYLRDILHLATHMRVPCVCGFIFCDYINIRKQLFLIIIPAIVYFHSCVGIDISKHYATEHRHWGANILQNEKQCTFHAYHKIIFVTESALLFHAY